MPSTADFDEFVVTRSPRLLRAAYLLTRDWAAAEDLLQTALAKAWFAWSRLDHQPEAYVRKIMFNTYASWWRRRSFGEQPADLVGRPEPHRRSRRRRPPGRGLAGPGPAPPPPTGRAGAAVSSRISPRPRSPRPLEISVGTVKSQAAKALAKLRQDGSLKLGTDLFEVVT